MMIIEKPFPEKIKQYIYILLFAVGAIFFLPNCKTEKANTTAFAHLQNQEVKNLLTKVIEKSGGLDNWKTIESLQFKKYFALYDSLGNTENAVNQIHKYNFFPNENINISWAKDSVQHLLNYQNASVTKTIDGNTDSDANATSLLNTVRSSTFVMAIPFNLLDPGVELRYLGEETLEDGKIVEVLQADFNPEKHSNHSTKDTWWYYFDKSSSLLVGYMVQHADHFSYVKNTTSYNVNGFHFPKQRKSWRVTKDREILYLRAEYEYSDYQLEMKSKNR